MISCIVGPFCELAGWTGPTPATGSYFLNGLRKGCISTKRSGHLACYYHRSCDMSNLKKYEIPTPDQFTAWLAEGAPYERHDDDTRTVKLEKTCRHLKRLRELIPLWDAANRLANIR